eukprot:TRINITY_DN33046_c0_g1_i1.p1 TRINITY_DN33046_c0_g1~~TRINITY_DN33046_c0_g1_i1.p1  ORF type:complete len:557 (+),score=8.62 TRINITY_DN33046_c0_g1_i1:293-1963(+)
MSPTSSRRPKRSHSESARLEPDSQTKRRRPQALTKGTPKGSSHTSPAVIPEIQIVHELQELRSRLVRDPVDNANIIIDILETFESDNREKVAQTATTVLSTFLSTMYKQGLHLQVQKSQDNSAPGTSGDVFAQWLRRVYARTTTSFLSVLSSSDTSEKTLICILDALRVCVSLSDEGPAQYRSLRNSLLTKVLTALVTRKEPSPKVITTFVQEWCSYSDVLYYTFKNFASLFTKTSSSSSQLDIRTAYAILGRLKVPDDSESLNHCLVGNDEKESAETPNWQSQKGIRKVFTTCWIEFLNLALPVDIYKDVLVRLRDHVLPQFTKPILLLDFLTTSYNIGGVISVLALNSLFLLMTKYNLEYPSFFPKVYSHLTPDIFFVRYRARFFKLLHLFFSSTHLPSYLVAAFIKRLARLALVAPPHGALVSMSLIQYLIVRHPQCMTLVTRTTTANVDVGEDPFQDDESDPAQSHALESSLWEVATLKNHYDPVVARMAETFEGEINQTEVGVLDLIGMTYDSSFDTQISRKTRRAAPLEFHFRSEEFSRWISQEPGNPQT